MHPIITAYIQFQQTANLNIREASMYYDMRQKMLNDSRSWYQELTLLPAATR